MFGAIGVIPAFIALIICATTFADQTLDFSVTVNDASLQLTVPLTADLDLTPSATTADFDSTTLTIGVGTNSPYGYALTMSVVSTDISRIGASVGDPVISTLAASAGGYSENDFTVNKWGYKITGDNYFPITSSIAPSEWVTSSAGNNVNNYITLGAKVDASLPAGNYNTTLTFNAVANQVDTSVFRLVYNPNGGTGITQPTTIEYGQTGTIASSAFTPPADSVFAGWASTDTGDGPYYDAGVSYTAPNDSTGGAYKLLYAMWAPDDSENPTPDPCQVNSSSCGSSGTTSGTTLLRAIEMAYTAQHKGMYEETSPGSGVYQYIDSWNGGTYQGNGRDVRFLMQDMTPEICASATAINSEALLLDIRDQKSYWVAKLADGKCWMTQNLYLDFDHTQAFTSSTTDIGWNASTHSYGTASWTPTYDTVTFSLDGNPGGSSYSYDPQSFNPGEVWVVSSGSASKDTIYTSASDCATGESISANACRHYHSGNFYNWTGALALTDSTSVTGAYEKVDSSICPRGWTLPNGPSGNTNPMTISNSSDFAILFKEYNVIGSYGTGVGTNISYANDGLNILRNSPLYFVRAGYIYGGQMGGRGIEGDYQTNTLSNYNADSFGLKFDNDVSIGPQGASRRFIGKSVRCIAR